MAVPDRMQAGLHPVRWLCHATQRPCRCQGRTLQLELRFSVSNRSAGGLHTRVARCPACDRPGIAGGFVLEVRQLEPVGSVWAALAQAVGAVRELHTADVRVLCSQRARWRPAGAHLHSTESIVTRKLTIYAE